MFCIFSWVFIFFVKACVFLSISLLYFKKKVVNLPMHTTYLINV